MYKIIGADGQPYGPVPVEQVRRWIAENRLNAQTLVQAEGMSDWRPLATFAELVTELKPPTPGDPNAAPPVPPLTASRPTAEFSARASNKIAAGVCGILLGYLGVHKFILGYTGAGLIMLLLSLLSCGLLAPVMSIIGIIEGIIYLTKTDPDFVRLYVEERREWF